MKDISRREVIGGIVAAVVAGTTGCLSTGEPKYPQMPESTLVKNDWRFEKEFERRLNETVKVENIEQEVSVNAVGEVWKTSRFIENAYIQLPRNAGFKQGVYGATKLTTNPSVSKITETSEDPVRWIIDYIEPRVMEKLKEQGAVNPERVRTDSVTVEDGEKATRLIHRMEYKYDSFSTEVDGKSVVVSDGWITVESQHAVWIHNGVIIVAGGTYPGEEGRLDIRSGKYDGDYAMIGFEPLALREEIKQYITLTS